MYFIKKKRLFIRLLSLILGIMLLFFFYTCKKDKEKTFINPRKPLVSEVAKITEFIVEQKDGRMIKGRILENNDILLTLKGEKDDYTKLAPKKIDFIGVSIDPKPETVQDFTKNITYTVTAENGNQVKYQVKTTIIHPNDVAEITSFQVQEPDGTWVDGDFSVEGEIHLLLEGENLTYYQNLTPKIVFEGADLDPKEEQDFNQNVTYTVTSISEKTQEYVVKTKFRQSVAKITVFHLKDHTGKIHEGQIEESTEPKQEYFIDFTLTRNYKYYQNLEPEKLKFEGKEIDPTKTKKVDFNDPVIYTVTSKNESYQAKYKIRINFKDIPCEISTAEEFQNMMTWFNIGGNSEAKCKLTEDIDFKNQTIKSIADFEGFFDGNDKTIFNLNIDGSSLFGASIKEIKDLTIDRITINDNQDSNAGTLIAITGEPVKIDNVHIKNADIQGLEYVGGFIGQQSNGQHLIKITNSSFEGKITSQNQIAGGIMGASAWSELENVHVDATIKAKADAGGLVGVGDTSIKKSSAQGQVISEKESAGGLVGYLEKSNDNNQNTVVIQESFSANEISSEQGVIGGLIGSLEAQKFIIISDVYTQGTLNFSKSTIASGGLIGGFFDDATLLIHIKNSYVAIKVEGRKPNFVPALVSMWVNQNHISTENFKYINGLLAPIQQGSTALTLGNLDQDQDFKDWDFGAIWKFNGQNAWPTLQWENQVKNRKK